MGDIEFVRLFITNANKSQNPIHSTFYWYWQSTNLFIFVFLFVSTKQYSCRLWKLWPILVHSMNKFCSIISLNYTLFELMRQKTEWNSWMKVWNHHLPNQFWSFIIPSDATLLSLWIIAFKMFIWHRKYRLWTLFENRDKCLNSFDLHFGAIVIIVDYQHSIIPSIFEIIFHQSSWDLFEVTTK